MTTKRTIYLIDGTAYVYRSYHAIRGLSNSGGLPTNAVFGFTRILIKLLEQRQPGHAVMVFDAKGPTFRHELYPDYKANRPPMPEDLAVQLPYIKKISEGFCLETIEKTGYEADDLIGTLAKQAEENGFSVVIVSGDKDLLQLVTEKVMLWDPMTDKITDVQAIRKKFGVDPKQMIDVMGLSGDASDNIPGVPGIGIKTAVSLVQTYDSMESLYNQLEKIKGKKQKENLINFKEQAFLSRDLVKIDTHAPIRIDFEDCRVQSPNTEILSELFRTLEFQGLQKSLTVKKAHHEKTYDGIYTLEDLDRFVDRLKDAPFFAIDTETTSKSPVRAQLVGLSFSMSPHNAFYVPIGHQYQDVPRQPAIKDVINRLKPVLENPNIGKIGQNIKYDTMVLKRHGIDMKGVIFDTMLASYLINPLKRAHNLGQISLDYLNHRMIAYEDVAGKGKNEIRFDQVPIEQAISYSCEDADITFQIYEILKTRLEEIGLMPLFNQIELPLIPVLMKMELLGICVDDQQLRQLSRSFDRQLEQLEAQIYALSGEIFNIKSSQQLGTILFEKLNLPVQKKTRKKTGYSTDVEVLNTLAEKHELPRLVLRHRTLSKLKSTYADALLDMIHPETGRIHTSFNQTVTATGRLSSSDPNLQNIPVKTEEGRQIRQAFIPRKGWIMMSADYSQIELRILAHCSDDPILKNAFVNDEDIHNRTAEEVFQVFPQMVTDDLRRQAKAINFGIIYGMSAYGLSKELSISRKMAQTYIDNYFARYSGVKRFIDETIETSRKSRQTSTLMGRIRHLPDINSTNQNVRQFAERTAINTPIQGSAADLIKLAMIRVDEALIRQQLKTTMLLTVHDELIFEVPPEELEMSKTLIKQTMEHIWELKVPLKVNIAWGKNWSQAH